MIVVILLVMIALMLIGMPIFYALGVSSALYLYLSGIDLSMISQSMVRGVNSYTMLSIPFFYLAGDLMNSSGITNKILAMSRAFVGHFKGGLAQTNILASVIFAGLSGSAAADVAALGSVLIPSMKEEGYDAEFASAITIGSSLIGPIIPPSVVIIMYGIVAQQSVGKLLMAGVLPGILLGLFLMVYTYFHAKKMNYPRYPRTAFVEKLKSMYGGIPALLMPLIIIGGILTGVFTPTEAAAIAVFYGIIIGMFFYKNITLKSLFKLTVNVGISSINTLILLTTATIFSWVVTKAKVPQMMINFLFSVSDNKVVVMLIMLLFLVLVGLFMMPTQALIVITPIFLPVAIELGVSPIQFGIVMVLTLVLGGATPPVGLLLYLCQDIAKIPFMSIVKAMVPIYVPIVLLILLVTFVPGISLWIPNLMF